jgi:hypothetical protein
LPCMPENRNAHTISVRNPELKDNFDDICVDERTVLKWILEKHGERVRSQFIRISI